MDSATAPLTKVPAIEFLLGQLEEGLAHKPSSRVEDGRSERDIGKLLRDLLKGRLDALGVREVRADADGLASAGVDLLGDRLVVRRIPGQEHDRVCLGESPGDGSALWDR